MSSSSFSPAYVQQRKERSGKREQSKEELLESVRAERAQRNEARQRNKAAATIQRHWRGFACRKHTRSQLLSQWVKAYAPAVSTPSTLLPSDQLLDEVVPPLLLCFWPPATPHTRQLATNGAPLDVASYAPPPAPAAVRGLVALLIRSILAPGAAANYCAASLDASRQAQWRWQAARLLLLCCSLIGPSPAGGPDAGALLDSAAARLIVLLLDPRQWKLPLPDPGPAQEQVLAVLRLAARTPAPVLGAAQRLAEAQHRQSGADGRPPSAQVAQRVLATALHLLRTCPDAATEPFVLRVLCVPKASELLSAATPDLAAGGQLAQQLLEAVTKLAAGARLGAGQSAAALGNLVSLLTAQSSALEPPHTACLYCRAVAALLRRTVATLKGRQAAEADAVRGTLEQLRPLGESSHLERLHATLEKLPGSSAAPAGQPTTLHGQREYADFCTALVTHLPTLRDLLRCAPPPNAQPPPPASAAPSAEVPAPLNSLAFDPAFLPKLWRWLATDLGLPLEAPAEATRGLDVASLRGGFSSLPPHHAAPLGLFCRVLQHLLLVLDDTELHDLQRPFTLGQARAMATSLNTLVFHTFFPVASPQAPAGQQPSTPGHQLLSEYAPLALRALYERDVRRPFCQPLLWVSPYLQMTGGASSGSSTSGRGIWGQRQKPEADGLVRIIGGFNADAVVACLTVGAAAEEDEAGGQALQAEKGAGRRPASLAGLLRVAPQCVPFSHRVELFRVLLAADKQRYKFHLAPPDGGVAPIKCTIRREALMDDAYAALGGGRAGDLRRRLVVTFVNAAGLLEAGLDQGGLMKEFLEQVVQTGLAGGYGLFQATQQGLAYPCPTADKQHMGLQLLEFLGSMVGKALYEGILLEAALAPFFVLRLQGRAPTFDDLLSLDPGLHRSLTQVKRYDGDVEDLGLTFTAEHDFFGQNISHELLPGRGSETVTSTTRLLYCHLLADWHLTSRLGRPADAFARGLSSVIPLASLRLFNPYEFNELISGGSDTGGLDLEDLMQHTQYSGGYSAASPAVKLFWKVALSLEPQQKGALLKFVTSCSRAPLGGFQHLQPPFTIHKVESPASVLALVGGKDVERLPSASTCYNMLKLPNYRRAATLREKLLYAIGSGAGFELS